MNTADQKRAQAAFDRVRARASADDASQRKYSTRCRRMPQLIQQSGLCQAIAFVQAKANGQGREAEAFRGYIDDLAYVVLRNALDGQRTATELADQSRTLPLQQYQAVSADALLCASWMKRYAEALLLAEEGDG